jgi:hypothetical protein
MLKIDVRAAELVLSLPSGPGEVFYGPYEAELIEKGFPMNDGALNPSA